MARTRAIKPSFFTNDALGEIDPLARLLFIGLWTIADREGRLEDRPKRIKAELLPYDDCDPEALLTALAEREFIVRYQVGERRLIQVVNFKKHQYPNVREGASREPAPNVHSESTVHAPDEHEPNSPVNLVTVNREPLTVLRIATQSARPAVGTTDPTPVRKPVGNAKVQAFFDTVRVKEPSYSPALSGQDTAEIKNCPDVETAQRLGRAWQAVRSGTFGTGFLKGHLTIKNLKAEVNAFDEKLAADRKANGQRMVLPEGHSGRIV